jgi:hypothetical protein
VTITRHKILKHVEYLKADTSSLADPDFDLAETFCISVPAPKVVITEP